MPPTDSPAHRTAEAYLALRDQDQVHARLQGPLPGWTFFDHPRLVQAFEDTLARSTFAPSPARAYAAFSAVVPRLAPLDADRAHHHALVSAAPAHFSDPHPTHRVRADLARLGRWMHWHSRTAWRTETFAAHPQKDAAVAALWAAWATGDCWSGRARWEQLFLQAAVQVFRSVAAARELPADVSDRAVSDLREAFFFRMIGGAPAGWQELAARVLETAAPDPITRLHASLSTTAVDRAALCLTCRGSWRTTVARVFPELTEALARARALAGPTPPWDALLDLHAALRLLRAWSHHDSPRPPAADYAILTQNRGRARGRLRAVLAGQPPHTILENVLALDALHARTDAALRRFAWAWAWQELAYDFSFDLHRAVTPACPPPASTLAPLSPEALTALPTWVLLVVYRGRLDHLVRWVQTGSTGDRDSAWARLLTDALPANLKDPPIRGARSASYRRLRAELSFSLERVLGAARERIAATANLRTGRTLKAAFIELHGESWHPAVPMLRSGFPTARKAAVAALPRLDTLLSDPTHAAAY